MSSINLRSLVRLRLGRDELLVILFFALYFLGFLIYEFTMYSHWNIPYGNLGFIAQEAISATHGTAVFSTGQPFWAADGSFSLWLIGPFVSVFGLPALFVLSPLLLISTGYVIYCYSRRRISGPESLVLTAMFLLSPPIVGQAAWGFDSIMIAMLLWTIFLYLLDSDAERISLGILLALVVGALLSKNSSSLLGLAVGTWLVLTRQRKGIGIIVIVLSIAWLATLEGIILPSAWHGPDPNVQAAWGYMGPTLLAKGSYVFSHPLAVIQAVEQHFFYLFSIVGAGVPFFILDPLGLVVSTPTLMGNVLSHFVQSTNVYNEYSYAVLPFVFLSASSGLAALQRVDRRILFVSAKTLGMIYLFSFSMLSLYPGYRMLSQWSANNIPTRTTSALSAAMLKVPHNALLLTRNRFEGIVFRWPYSNATYGLVARVMGSLYGYRAVTGREHFTMYYLGSDASPPGGSVSWLLFLLGLPHCNVPFSRNSVFLLACRVNISEVAALHPLSAVAMFTELRTAEVKYLSDRRPIGSLSPLVLEKAGLLSPVFGGFPVGPPNANNFNWTFTGGWVGAWGRGDVAVGIQSVTGQEVTQIMRKYKAALSQVLFPYPTPWVPTSNGGTGFALFIFPQATPNPATAP